MSDETINRWFSSNTIADSQLQSVINQNNFQRKVPTYKEISHVLFNCDNIYDNYKSPEILPSLMKYESHIQNNTLQRIKDILGYSPKIGVEVGSFIGSSAIILGNMLKEQNGVLLCVDTWCGDINMWLMDRFQNTMMKADGDPKLYHLFITNMQNNNLTDTVIPIRVSSIVAARMLKVLNYEIDFIYLDSAHEAGETFMELMLYHDVLKSNGVLLGDDYNRFPAVKYDVDLFCNYYNYKLEFTMDSDTWIIQKNI
jgi:predicted O-methyltransferase YrrM